MGDEALGLSKGYGYVECESESDAKAVIAHLHGGQIDGNTIKVELAHDRQKRIAAEKAAAAEQMARKLAPPVSSAAPMRSTNRVPEKAPVVRKERNDRERDRDRDKERGRENRDRDRRDKSRDREKERQKEKERAKAKEKERA